MMQKKAMRIGKWMLMASFGALLTVSAQEQAHSGPGSDSALKDNRDMCSLPPFLNVAVSDKPNIIVALDNSTSMSLPAYVRPYDRTREYYGFFDPAGCYAAPGGGGQAAFTKNPVFGEETATIDGYWQVNPEWEDNEARDEMRKNDFRCDSGSYAHGNYPFSGNFLNWGTMRRIDLLRKAFVGGPGNNQNTQTASHIAGDGAQQNGGPAGAICFNKTYFGEGVSPFAINDFKVQDGRVIYGEKCPASADGTTASLDGSLLEDPLDVWVTAAKSRLANEAESRKSGAFTPLGEGLPQLASLMSVQGTAAMGLIAGSGPMDLSVEIRHLDVPGGVVPRTTGNPAGRYPGSPVNISVVVRNHGGSTGNPSTITFSLGGTTLNGQECATPTVLSGESVTIDCQIRVPDVNQGPYPISAYLDPAPNGEHASRQANNTHVYHTDFYAYKSVPDIYAKSVHLSGGVTSVPPGGEVTLITEVVNVGHQDIGERLGGVIVYMSTNAGVSASDTEIGRCDLPATQAWPSYASDTGALQVVTVVCTMTVPAGLNPASYENGHIGVVLNPGPVNQYGPARKERSTPLSIGWAKPDLTVQGLQATPNTNLAEGSTVTLDFQVHNSGGEPLSPFGVSIQASTSSTYDASAATLPSVSADCSVKRSIGAGQTLYYTCDVTVPAGVPDGHYYLFVTADPDNAVDEANTDNNTGMTPVYVGTPIGAIDLILTNVNVSSIAPPAHTLDISFRINNIGSIDTTSPPKVSIRLLDQWGTVIHQNDLDNCVAPTIIAGSSYRNMTCTLNIPGTTDSPGVNENETYTVELHVNPPSVSPLILESDYTNNKEERKLTIRNDSCSNCNYQLRVDWGGRGRVGIFWNFRQKTIGGAIPAANMGYAQTGSFTGGGGGEEPWSMAGDFFGVNGGQLQANSMIPIFLSTNATQDGSLARLLLNVVKYYGNVEAFRHTGGPGGGMDPILYDPITDSMGSINPCRSNYVMLITDGYTYGDNHVLPSHIPGVSGDLRHYEPHFQDPTASDPIDMTDGLTFSVRAPNVNQNAIVDHANGTFHLDNVARYANWNDMRPDLDGSHNVNTVVVHAFADGHSDSLQAQRATQLLRAAAIAGNYGPSRTIPDVGDIPDGYFASQDNEDVGELILRALDSILLKTASGTSVSVIAATARGEGAVYQSYFRPTTATAGNEVNWLGYLQALWVDRHNQFREDSDGDGRLILEEDRIIEYDFDAETLETIAYLWDSDADGLKVPGSRSEPMPLTDLNPIFEAGKQLHRTAPDDRYIFTFVAPKDQAAVGGSYQQLAFTAANADILQQYMWPAGNLYSADYPEQVTMTEHLIEWTRGKTGPLPSFRSRRIEVDNILDEWKLGDIVYSTPTIVGPPEERYDLLYGDRSYSKFFVENRQRRRLVIVGSNAGMLHAFNGGVFHEGDDPATDEIEAAYYDKQGLELGQEVWAYAPGALLENMRIYADSAYDTTCHISSVDLRPKVTDARIFLDTNGDPLDEDKYVNGWGTILIGGMRLGCGRKEFSSYFILDITDPDDPNVLAEFGPSKSTTLGNTLDVAGEVTDLSGLNFSYFYPDIMRVRETDGGHSAVDNSRWYMVVGSGPDTLHANNENTAVGQTGIFIFDLTKLAEASVGALRPGGNSPKLEDFAHVVNRFDHDSDNLIRNTEGPGGIMISGGVPADLNGDYNVDAIYLTTQYDDRADLADGTVARWGSEVWRLIPYNGTGNREVENARDWGLTKIFSTRNGQRRQPIVAAPSISRDSYGDIWVYFGTGRFLYRPEGLQSQYAKEEFDDLEYGTDDINDKTKKQSLYGLVDGCWSPARAAAFPGRCPTTASPYMPADLFESTYAETWINPDTNTEEIRNTGLDCGGDECTLADVHNAVKSGVTQSGPDDFYGWRKGLVEQSDSATYVWEMSYNKPAVAGGLVLFTTYVPGVNMADTCALAGRSFLHALDFMGGVASPSDVLREEDPDEDGTFQRVLSSVQTDNAPPSPPSIYNNVVFVQSSTARPIVIETDAKFSLAPRARSWEEE